jgi:hypothetical protein
MKCTPSSTHMLRQITLFYYYLLEWRAHPLGLGVCWDANGFMAWWILFLECCYTWEVVLGGSYKGTHSLVVVFDTWSTLMEHSLLVHDVSCVKNVAMKVFQEIAVS